MSAATPTPAARIGDAKRRFDLIRLDYGAQTLAVCRMDGVRLAALGRPAGDACGGAMLVAPTGVGKSEAVRRLQRHVAAACGDDGPRIPVLPCEIDSSGTVGSVPSSILKALGAPRPDVGKEPLRWLKAVAAMQDAGVQLLVIDEFNRANRRPTMSRPIVTAIREKIMDAGVAPVAFVGSEEAAVALAKCPELIERLDEQIDLDPLEWDHPDDRAMFERFVADLDQRLVADALMPTLSGLAAEGVVRPLWEASSGRVRRLMKIVRSAMALALESNALTISRQDLEDAVEGYAVRGGFIGYNPFEPK